MTKQESNDRIYLTDDGTMDTVLRCDRCGEEMRYNYDGSSEGDGEQTYDEFVDWAISDAEKLHDCEETD